MQSVTIQPKYIFSGNLQFRYWLVVKKVLPKQKGIFEFLKSLQQVSADRWYFTYSVDDQVEYHVLNGFSDSLLVVYGLCIYLNLYPGVKTSFLN